MSKRIKAIIFDLDGTLLDTLQDLAQSVNYALAKFDLPQRSLDEIRNFVGNGIGKLIERSVPAGSNKLTIEQVFSTFKAHYAIHSTDNTRCYDGINELLDELYSRDYKIAIASNKINSAVQELNSRFFEKYSICAIGECEKLKRKPSPDLLLHCMNQLQCAADEVLYVGDSEVDIETSRNAGVPIVAVSWGFRDVNFLKTLHPDFLIHHPSELLDILNLSNKSLW